MTALTDLLTRLELRERPHDRAALQRLAETAGAPLRIAEAMAAVPRHAFVPAEAAPLAYAPSGLWLPSGAVLPAPEATVQILSALDPQPGERVLEYGTGSGYLTILLAQLAKEVVTVDTNQRSGGILEVAQLPNVTRGETTEGVFDAVLMTMPQLVFTPTLLAGARRGVFVIGPPFSTQRLLLARGAGADATPELFDLGSILLPASTLAYAPVSIPPPAPGSPMPLEGA